MREHELKTWPEPFQAVLDGRKRFEVRKDDRGFAVGDLLRLKEWEPSDHHWPYGRYTGRETLVRVTYLLPGGRFGIPEHHCIMSIDDAARCP